LARMNFAVQLAGGRLPGVKLELADNTNPGALREGVQLGSPEFQKH